MKTRIFGLLAIVVLLAAGSATAGPVEILGGLNLTGISGTDGVTFPDSTKQTTAGITSIEDGGGLTITSPGVISIAPGGVGDDMLATGISGSKIITGSISQSQVAPIRAPVLNTGQLITYAEGDDGNLKYGAAVTGGRFTDNGNGTVTDNLTGLIWLQNANCTDTVGGISKSTGSVTWANALTWSNNLASGFCSLTDDSVAGDWRLPNVNELESLIDASNPGPALPTGHPFLNVQSDGYWSSTTWAYVTGNALYVIISAGGVTVSSKTSSFYVWSVRGGRGKVGIPKTGQTATYGTSDDGALKKGVVWPALRFTNNNDGTVTDNLTGLIWLQNANCFSFQTWTAALSSANTLANGSCGLTDNSVTGDWRLPSRRELKSLINYSKANPALPTGHPFLNVHGGPYWSSTTYAPNAAYAWSVNVGGGGVPYDGKAGLSFGWPVRGGQ